MAQHCEPSCSRDSGFGAPKSAACASEGLPVPQAARPGPFGWAHSVLPCSRPNHFSPGAGPRGKGLCPGVAGGWGVWGREDHGSLSPEPSCLHLSCERPSSRVEHRSRMSPSLRGRGGASTPSHPALVTWLPNRSVYTDLLFWGRQGEVPPPATRPPSVPGHLDACPPAPPRVCSRWFRVPVSVQEPGTYRAQAARPAGLRLSGHIALTLIPRLSPW